MCWQALAIAKSEYNVELCDKDMTMSVTIYSNQDWSV